MLLLCVVLVLFLIEWCFPLVMPDLCHTVWCAAVAFYGHYDIQPAEEPVWQTNPLSDDAG